MLNPILRTAPQGLAILCALVLPTLAGAAIDPFAAIKAARARAQIELKKAPSGAPAVATSTPKTYGFIADGGLWNTQTQQIALSLAKSGVYDLIMAGDNLYDDSNNYDDAWAPWKTAEFNFPLVAIGNHNAGYANEVQYFGMPGEYYAKVSGYARFIILNSDNESTATEQAAFLKNQLQSATEKHVFVVYHHPSATITNHHRWQDRKKFQEAVRPLLKAYSKRITALLVGHDHMAALEYLDDLPMVVSGATFEQTASKKVDFDDTDLGVHVKTEWAYKGQPYWTRVDVGATEVWINFVRADNDQVDCSARIAPRPLLVRDNCAKTGL